MLCAKINGFFEAILEPKPNNHKCLSQIYWYQCNKSVNKKVYIKLWNTDSQSVHGSPGAVLHIWQKLHKPFLATLWAMWVSVLVKGFAMFKYEKKSYREVRWADLCSPDLQLLSTAHGLKIELKNRKCCTLAGSALSLTALLFVAVCPCTCLCPVFLFVH